MLRPRTALWLSVVGVWLANAAAFAEVSPEIELAARGIISFNWHHSSDETYSEVSDFSDSGPLIAFRQKLYSSYRGQMVIGFQFPDAGSGLGQLFFHQIFLKVENRSNILRLGRSRAKSSLVEFPTFRDDDALHHTDLLNPFSSGRESEDSQYGNVLEVSRLFEKRFWLNIHGEHLAEGSQQEDQDEADFSFNAAGIAFEYRVPETQRWNRQALNQIGIGFQTFFTDRPGYSNDFDQAVKSFIFATAVNVRPDPVHFWDLRHQTVVNLGFDEIGRITDYADLTRARSIATFTSLRYLYRRLERPTAQVSAAIGYKNFPELSNSTDQLQLLANALYRLGENFDAGLQFKYQNFNGDLEKLYGKDEAQVQLALIYSVDQIWNSQFDDRESLLNLEHGYIP